MLIGIDFDNTIVCYDTLFHKVARENGLIPDDLPASKGHIREYLCQKGQEDVWTKLQGIVYGARMLEATPFPGMLDFFSRCKDLGISFRIISHRTRYPFMGQKKDLHHAAREWIRHHGFYESTGLSPEHVHFELTKQKKLNRIVREGCDCFIDDLPEFLAEPEFPANVMRILFDPNKRYQNENHFQYATSWNEIIQLIMESEKVVFNTNDLKGPVSSLLSKVGFNQDFEIHHLRGGANNKVYRIDVNNSQLCLKAYFHHPDDPRDRLDTEFSFTSFAWNKGLRVIPQPLAYDTKNRLALYQFIPGRKLRPEEINQDMVQQALQFYRDLNLFKGTPEARSLPRASESCFSIVAHLELVTHRIAKLRALKDSSPIESEAVQFVNGELLNEWKKVIESVHQKADQLSLSLEEEISRSDWCLSPSDFGFHNAILAADGKLCFIDFEYAGWDDPAKMACDFFCQPSLPIPLEYYNYFVSKLQTGLNNPEHFRHRADLLLPAHRIKWCCIMLNEFLAVDNERRRYALHYKDNRKIQLDKARKALSGHG